MGNTVKRPNATVYDGTNGGHATIVRANDAQGPATCSLAHLLNLGPLL
jgi:hypothetical protein